MADPQAEARIRDLERRMAAMPGSRIFVGLAEEYRRAGRFHDALATLRTGLEAHPAYLSARIAIARLYHEMGRDEEAIDAFVRVLAADRENLVAAKALGDLHSRHGNPLEAVKKYKLYRALSGDRTIDERITALERDTKPEVLPSAPPAAPSPPAPRMFDPINFSDSSAEFRFDPNATMSLSTLEFAPEPSPTAELDAAGEARVGGMGETASGIPEPAAPPASPVESAPAPSLADVTLPDFTPPVNAAEWESATEIFESRPAAETAAPLPEGPSPETSAESPQNETATEAAPELPPSRTLAELYEKQGFREEARRIYERLAEEHPDDESLTRRIATVRGDGVAGPAAADPRERRRQALEGWLARVKANAAAEDRP